MTYVDDGLLQGCMMEKKDAKQKQAKG